MLGISLSAAQADDDREEGYRSAGNSDKHGGKYGGENRGSSLQTIQANAKWKQECSNCHIAYVPGLLPAESWRKLMAGLDKHFGSDATLDASDAKEITAYLVDNASNRWRAPTAPLRITESAWFKSKHDSHEISPAVWKNPRVKSPANCQACHSGAEKGDFSEDKVRIPK
ncbi:MAG: diheme cytochrome c [Nitrosomonadales bacterium]|nr:diheme cytochrome c [Nitrosomonadales bacterium]